MTPAIAFTLLLLGCIGWISIPFIPALAELLSPRDAAPLNAVGNDAGRLTYFATSFTERATAEGLLGTMVPPRLDDGTAVRTHAAATPLPATTTPIRELVVFFDDTPVPDGITLASECLARMTVRGGTGVTYRALLGQRDVLLGRKSTVLRWVHARGRLEVLDGSRLLGRATADRDIALAPNVGFDRLEADVVRVVGLQPPDTPVRPVSDYPAWTPEKALVMSTDYWRVEGSVTIPAGCAMVGSLVATGSVVVGDGARVQGSIKAHGDVRVARGAVVIGSLSARGRVIVDTGARLSGPLISEVEAVIGAAIVGISGKRTTVTAPRVRLARGATVYGAVMAADGGFTTA
jgi:predicted acyltransferase (DUF342 family)